MLVACAYSSFTSVDSYMWLLRCPYLEPKHTVSTALNRFYPAAYGSLAYMHMNAYGSEEPASPEFLHGSARLRFRRLFCISSSFRGFRRQWRAERHNARMDTKTSVSSSAQHRRKTDKRLLAFYIPTIGASSSLIQVCQYVELMQCLGDIWRLILGFPGGHLG